MQHQAALFQRAVHVVAIERELDLVEADDRHDERLELALEQLRLVELVLTKLVVAIQDADLDDDLDHVLHDFLGGLLRAGPFLRHPVEVVQDATARVVDEDLRDLLRCHLAEKLLLDAHAQGLGVKVTLLSHCR